MVEDRRMTMVSLDSPDLGDQIKRFRTRLHLSQTELAQRAGVSNGYLSSIESGSRPSAIILDKIMGALRTIRINGSAEGEDNLETLIQKIVDMGYDVTVTRRG
jgi:transcriptional regulator with XRE-family HTH domain